MAQGDSSLTTYYAKRVIGDSATYSVTEALLQTGANVVTDTWLLFRNNRGNPIYGIKYKYDSSSNADKLELYGGYQVSSTNTPTAWVQMNTGDTYILGKVGINYDPNTSGNNYYLVVNGTSLFKDDLTIYTSGTDNSPSLIFQREATIGGDYIDWRILDASGALIFQDIGTHTSNAWTTRVSFKNDGSYIYTNIAINGKLHITSQEDVGKNQAGALIIGNKTGTNIGIDDNEIMARNNSAVSALYINNEGGAVYIGSGTLNVASTITATAGLLKSTLNGNTVTIGSQNNGWCHIYNSANIGFIFNNNVATTSGNLGTSDYRWNNSYFKGTMYFNHGYINGAATNGGINLIMTGDDAWIGDCNVAGCFGVKASNSTTQSGIYFYGSNGTNYARLLSAGGSIYLNNNNSVGFVVYTYPSLQGNFAYVLSAGGATFVPIYASAFTVASSKLIKENIKSMNDEEAKKILKIRPVTFDYKKKFGGQKEQRGMIAEEVEELIPSVIRVPDDYDPSKLEEDFETMPPVKSIDYAKFTPYLIKLAQIQQKEIDDLKLQLKQLQEK